MKRLIVALILYVVWALPAFAVVTTVSACSVYAGSGNGAALATYPNNAQCVADASARGVGTFTIKTTVTNAPDPVNSVSLSVAGAPNLPYNGTTTAVTVGFTVGTPTKVELSRDGYPPFGVWPTGSFFTLAPDGKSLTGSWCISASCWGFVQGQHILNVVATYSNGTTANASVSINVADAPPVFSTEWTGMTTAMWSEVNAQRAAFGDPNNCKARVDAIPTSGFPLAPGGNIANALASNNVVILQTGVYPISAPFSVPPNKKLVGGPGQHPIIDAAAIANIWAIALGDNSVFANIELRNAPGVGLISFNTVTGTYSNNGLIFQALVHDNGMGGVALDNGTGILIIADNRNLDNIVGGKNWCVVSSAVFNTFNATGNGNNSDGIDSTNGSDQNSFIDVHSRNTGDDGFDTWHAGQTYWYFSGATTAGDVPGKSSGGDGNGIKFGPSTIAHKFYKTTANNNLACGFVRNGDTPNPILVQSTATGNPGGNYCLFPAP